MLEWLTSDQLLRVVDFVVDIERKQSLGVPVDGDFHVLPSKAPHEPIANARHSSISQLCVSSSVCTSPTNMSPCVFSLLSCLAHLLCMRGRVWRMCYVFYMISSSFVVIGVHNFALP